MHVKVIVCIFAFQNSHVFESMRRFITTILLVCGVLFVHGQTDTAVVRIQRYLTNLHAFNKAYPQEKVYLHLDNRSYYIGDTIWFKAYVTNASTLKFTDVSRILYVELLNDKGVEMETKKLRIENGQCYGEFALKEHYYTGYYELRAYTRNMLNFGNESLTRFDLMTERQRNLSILTEEEARQDLVPGINHCVFSRTVPVYARPDSVGVYKREFEYYPLHTKLVIPDELDPRMRPDDIQVRFYPEGGNLVEGVPSVVAIEACDQWGREKRVMGEVLCGKEVVANFVTGARGRTLMSFTPVAGKRYSARVEYKGDVYTFPLPDALDEGYVLQLSPTASVDAYVLTMTASPTVPRRLLGWSLQCRGALTAFDTVTLAPGQALHLRLDKKQLCVGVNQFTLFDDEGRVWADRLFFVAPPTTFPRIRVELPADSLKPFEEVDLHMQLCNTWGRGMRGYLSVSVADADDDLPTYDKGDIRTELLLTSDLKGFVKDIDSYFSHASPRAVHADIDLLMLIQGWRRYEWVAMAEGADAKLRYSPEKGYVVDGYVADQYVEDDYKWNASRYKRIANPWVAIDLKSEQVSYRDTVQANEQGEFSIDIPRHFLDDAGLSIEIWRPEGRGKSGKRHKYSYVFPSLHCAFSPMPAPYHYYESHSPSDDYELQLLENVDVAMERVIDEVTIKKRNKQRHEIHYDRPDIVIDFVKEYNTIIDRGVHALTSPPQLKRFYDPTVAYTLARSRIPDELRYIFVRYNNATKDSLTYAYYERYMMQRMPIKNPNEKVTPSVSNGEYVDDEEKGYVLTHYQLPKEIRLYSNLVSRSAYPIKQDDATDHRLLLWAHTTYYAKDESPMSPPYDMRDGTRHTTFKGYSRVVEYYHRDYSQTSLPDTADYRRTLYWNPDVETDHQGRFSLSFYNNAHTKRIVLTAEGITAFGDPVTVREAMP